ncbi:MAG: 2TM domain-containing protein [Gammaproteobacteria bacterium]
MGWGIGVIFHAIGVFFLSGGSRIKERMIDKEMKKQAPRSEKL